MKKISTLLATIKTAIPTVLQNRINTLNAEIAKLPALEEAQKNTPSDENQEALDKQNELVLQIEESIVSRLEKIIENQTELEEKLKTNQQPNPQNPPAPNTEQKEKKSNGFAYVALGVLGIALTLGAVNIFKNKN